MRAPWRCSHEKGPTWTTPPPRPATPPRRLQDELTRTETDKLPGRTQSRRPRDHRPPEGPPSGVAGPAAGRAARSPPHPARRPSRRRPTRRPTIGTQKSCLNRWERARSEIPRLPNVHWCANRRSVTLERRSCRPGHLRARQSPRNPATRVPETRRATPEASAANAGPSRARRPAPTANRSRRATERQGGRDGVPDAQKKRRRGGRVRRSSPQPSRS